MRNQLRNDLAQLSRSIGQVIVETRELTGIGIAILVCIEFRNAHAFTRSRNVRCRLSDEYSRENLKAAHAGRQSREC